MIKVSIQDFISLQFKTRIQYSCQIKKICSTEKSECIAITYFKSVKPSANTLAQIIQYTSVLFENKLSTCTLISLIIESWSTAQFFFLTWTYEKKIYLLIIQSIYSGVLINRTLSPQQNLDIEVWINKPWTNFVLLILNKLKLPAYFGIQAPRIDLPGYMQI